jgi:hypothetical protein
MIRALPLIVVLPEVVVLIGPLPLLQERPAAQTLARFPGGSKLSPVRVVPQFEISDYRNLG